MENSPGNPSTLRPLTDFEVKKWALNDYFGYYRSGNDEGRLMNDGHAPWQTAQYFPGYHVAPDPRQLQARPKEWNEIYKQQTSSSLEIHTDTSRYPAAPQPTILLSPDEVPDPMRGEAARVAQLQSSSINNFSIPINIKRVLGKGGMGLALLCASSSPAPGGPREFCLKADLSDSKCK